MKFRFKYPPDTFKSGLEYLRSIGSLKRLLYEAFPLKPLLPLL